jgi:ribonuclease G
MPYELLVSRIDGRRWAAVRQDGETLELRVEPNDDRPRSGRILRARVSKVLPGMQAAFVDLGGERGAFLHASALPPVATAGSPPPIEQRLREGEVVTVQVEREALRGKGARVTCRLSVPGTSLVLMPGGRGVAAVSRRIRDRAERSRLAQLLARLPGEDDGWIARTAARGQPPETLCAEAEWLLACWRKACSSASATGAGKLPCVVLREPGFVEELLAGVPEEELHEIVLDDAADRQALLDGLVARSSSLVTRVRLHSSTDAPLFVAAGVAPDLDRALRRRVWLRSGGYLVIEETEALVSIDVNTGKHTGKTDLERTVLRTNLEAAAEVPRQLRLRGLGGIVVVDMIDMEAEDHRAAVLERLRTALRDDPARTRVAGVDEFGLVVLTRKATRPGLLELATERCPSCRGSGRLRSP